MIRLHKARWPENFCSRSSGLVSCAAAGPAARSAARTGPARRASAAAEGRLDPSKETSHGRKRHSDGPHLVHGRQLGTSAIGRCRTRHETFSRVDALGEIDPVVDNSSDRERQKISVLDDAGDAPSCRASLPVSEPPFRRTTLRLAAGRARPCPLSAPGSQPNDLEDDQTVAHGTRRPDRSQGRRHR